MANIQSRAEITTRVHFRVSALSWRALRYAPTSFLLTLTSIRMLEFALNSARTSLTVAVWTLTELTAMICRPILSDSLYRAASDFGLNRHSTGTGTVTVTAQSQHSHSTARRRTLA